jgi:hypothetical protein
MKNVFLLKDNVLDKKLKALIETQEFAQMQTVHD